MSSPQMKLSMQFDQFKQFTSNDNADSFKTFNRCMSDGLLQPVQRVDTKTKCSASLHLMKRLKQCNPFASSETDQAIESVQPKSKCSTRSVSSHEMKLPEEFNRFTSNKTVQAIQAIGPVQIIHTNRNHSSSSYRMKWLKHFNQLTPNEAIQAIQEVHIK
jgi:hypothetical protein